MIQRHPGQSAECLLKKSSTLTFLLCLESCNCITTNLPQRYPTRPAHASLLKWLRVVRLQAHTITSPKQNRLRRQANLQTVWINEQQVKPKTQMLRFQLEVVIFGSSLSTRRSSPVIYFLRSSLINFSRS